MTKWEYVDPTLRARKPTPGTRLLSEGGCYNGDITKGHRQTGPYRVKAYMAVVAHSWVEAPRRHRDCDAIVHKPPPEIEFLGLPHGQHAGDNVVGVDAQLKGDGGSCGPIAAGQKPDSGAVAVQGVHYGKRLGEKSAMRALLPTISSKKDSGVGPV